MLALLVGGLCVVGGIARLGFVTDLLSKPVRVGYLNGIALTVIVSQLPALFGFSVDGDTVPSWARGFVEGLDDADASAFVLGASCLALILVVRRTAPMVPGMLIAVVAATVAVVVLDLDVPVVGSLPSGLPSFALPSVDAGDLGRLAAAAVGIAFVAFADTSVLSRSYATRLGERVDQNQELVALGAVNAASGLFGGFPLSSSSSRTPVAETAGARTQLTGVVGAVAIGILLVAAPSLTANLPSAALAAIVIAAAISIADVGWVARLYRVRRSEWVLSMACFLAVALFGVLWGIGIAVGLSLLNVVRRAWRPYDAVLGRVDGFKGYHDTFRHPEARLVPGLLLYRFDAPLFFANADIFRDRLLDLVRRDASVRRVCVAAEAMTDIDVTAAGILAELVDELAAREVEFSFAELKGPVKDRLAEYGLADRIGRDRFYPTIGVAVHSYVVETGVEWEDWEDAAEGDR